MRALVLVQPGRVELQQRADPTPGPGEVLLKVEATTLCGTDLRIISGAKTAGVRPGVVMGHEIAGRVAALGDGVTGYDVGQQATPSIVLSCNHCRTCLLGYEHLCENLRLIGYEIDGGLADYCLIPAQAVAQGNLTVTISERPQVSQPNPLSQGQTVVTPRTTAPWMTSVAVPSGRWTSHTTTSGFSRKVMAMASARTFS